MATIWKGAINFGLVNVPVKLVSAVSSENVSFRRLHKECKTPLKQKNWCNECDMEVKYEDIIKGYEYEKDAFVEITEEEIKTAVKSNKYIQIMDFIKLDEIDPIYYKKAYYLQAETAGEKPYLILYKAMQDTKSVAVSKITIRDKEHLCIVRVYNDILMLNTMYFGDEVISTAALNMDRISKKTEVLDMEMQMARQIVQNLTSPFDVGKYHDEYREQLLNLVRAKSEGEDVIKKEGEEEKPSAKSLDLFERLKESVQATMGSG